MLGYSYADMIILCSFNGENCFESDFWTFYHSVYGNCYSFNTGKNGAIQKTSLAGPSNGGDSIILKFVISCVLLYYPSLFPLNFQFHNP